MTIPLIPAKPSASSAAVPPVELKANELRGKAPLSGDELLHFAAAADDSQLLGQERALDAIRLATGIDAPGYNVFVTGLRSRAERDSILRLLEAKAATMPTPGDWVYVNNFRSPETPTAIYLPPGQGVELRKRMRELVDFIVDQLPKAFRREDFDNERSGPARQVQQASAGTAWQIRGARSRTRLRHSKYPIRPAGLYPANRGEAARVTRRTLPQNERDARGRTRAPGQSSERAASGARQAGDQSAGADARSGGRYPRKSSATLPPA